MPSIIQQIRRIPAEIRVTPRDGGEEIVVPARLILTDLNPARARLFASVFIQPEQVVTVKLPEPVSTEVKADVKWCKAYDLDAHIVSENAFCYRVELVFKFENDEQKMRIAEAVSLVQNGRTTKAAA